MDWARRLGVMLPLALLGTGCATGLPAGARSGVAQLSYRRFSPPGLRREVPPPLAPSPVSSAAPDPAPFEVKGGARAKAVELARQLVGESKVVVDGKRYGGDCTGLVLGVYGGVGLDLLERARRGDNGVTAIYRFARERGRIYEGGWPLPGDLAFFRDTYDQNRDGRLNDGLTHVGIVEAVEPDGTVTVIHRVSRGVVRYRMNLHAPERRVGESGRVLNDYLRSARAGTPAALTGQLFAAYATLLPVD